MRCCAPPLRTTKSGSRASATSSRSGRTTSSACCINILVNGVRAEFRACPLIVAKAAALATSADRQIVTLSTGEEISARLIVLANGLNVGLRDKLGMTREVLSPNHSISIGFDIVPVGRPRFEFPALTSFPDRAAERMAYVTFFPIGTTMRANLFVYRDMADPWLRQMRKEPEAALLTLQPSLRNSSAISRSRSR